MNTLVIFHSINGVMHCDDGFGAAWVAHLALPNAHFHAGIYGQEPPLDKAKGGQVYLVDFSYKRDPMRRLIDAATHVTVLDHHKTAREELEHLDSEFPLSAPHIVFSEEHSGAHMAWDYWFGPRGVIGKAAKMPELITRIEDGDLWRWVYPDSKPVQAALRSYPQDFETWDRLMAMPIADLAAEGVAIRRFIEAKLRELAPDMRWARVGGYEVPVCNAPKFLSSELAGKLAEDHPEASFAATYADQAGVRSWSLRSRNGFDVSTVAKAKGGGGHAAAAGFEEPLS